MKLELKHLSAYLPFKLKCQIVDYYSPDEISEAVLNAVWSDGSCSFFCVIESKRGFESVKPILRPLSDFEKFDDIVNCMSSIEIEFLMSCIIIQKEPKNGIGAGLKYYTMLKMFEYHIDVFGLIEKGLAVQMTSQPVSDK